MRNFKHLTTVAALGLALSGSADAAEHLRTAYAKERSPFARSVLAQALGVVGEPKDAGTLVAALDTVDDPILIVQHAAALAFHGSEAAARGVLDALGEGRGSASTRVGLLQALGMLLDETPPFRLAALSADANFSAFPYWLNAPLQSTL